jgi:hypothetical protein
MESEDYMALKMVFVAAAEAVKAESKASIPAAQAEAQPTAADSQAHQRRFRKRPNPKRPKRRKSFCNKYDDVFMKIQAGFFRLYLTGKFLFIRGLKSEIHRYVEKDVEKLVDNCCKRLIGTILYHFVPGFDNKIA